MSGDMSTEGSTSWTPDGRTIKWLFGVTHEDRVWRAIKADVRNRGEGVAVDSDEYWKLVAEAGIEAILYDALRMAKDSGARMNPEDIQ